MPTRSIPVGQLLLDVENPRHGQVQSQRDAIVALVEKQGTKLVKLAEHIAKNGLSPIDATLVTKKGQSYIVLEGNRRLAALRLLVNPDLAEGTKYAKDFKKIAKAAPVVPEELECAVVDSREDGATWIKLRHTGQAEGVGVVPWGSQEVNRFENRPGSQGGKAIAFIDTVAVAYPKNAVLQANLVKLGSSRLTTLGRLVADPEFRKRLGLEEKDGRFLSHYPAELLEDAVDQLATDLATTLSVTSIKTKEQRTKYLSTLPTPDADARRAEAQPLVVGSAGSLASKKAARHRANPRPGPIFKDLVLKKLGSRISAILNELRQMDLDRYPNAAAILCRVLLELTVDRVHEKKKWQPERELRKRVQKCLNEIDPKQKDKTYQSVRTGLNDGTSLYAVSTLNAFVHNEHFHPTATEVRAFADNYGPFLLALDGLV